MQVLRQTHRLPYLLVSQLETPAAKQSLKHLDRSAAAKVDRRSCPVEQDRIKSLSQICHIRPQSSFVY